MQHLLGEGNLSPRLAFKAELLSGLLAETDFIQRKSAIWHLRGAEGDHLTERSEGRKLPQQMPRCPRHSEVIDNLLMGCSGGSAEGAKEGRSP